jgi:diguanylate cyclase (GGDEF)-like protein
MPLLGASPPAAASFAYFFAFLPNVAAIVAIVIVAWMRGSRGARYVAPAWIAPVATGSASLLRHFGAGGQTYPWDFAFYGAVALQAVIMALAIAWRIGEMRRERDRAVAQEGTLSRLAETDGLTGLPNRRAFDRRHWRKGDFLAVIDLDHFKQVNDRHGHQIGDEALRACGSEMAAQVEAGALLAAWRLGGEEFAVLVAADSSDAAALAVNRVRERIASGIRGQVPGIEQAVTCSAGLSPIGSRGISESYQAADRALYCAKASGRDRLCYEIGESQVATIFPRPRPRPLKVA